MHRPSLPIHATRPITLALALVAGIAACATKAPPIQSAPMVAAATPTPTAASPQPPDVLATVPAISAATLEPRLATASAPLVLDVRTPEEYAAGHLPGARLIPHDQLAQRLAEVATKQDQEVIVYCRTGRRAALAMDTLKRAGFSRVGHLQGDYQAWSAEGRAIVVTTSAPSDAAADQAP